MLTFLIVISFGWLVFRTLGLISALKRVLVTDDDVTAAKMWFASLVLFLALLLARIFG